MQIKRLGISTKFVTSIAAIYSILIIILAVSFHYIIKTNSGISRELILKNNEIMLMAKSEIIVKTLDLNKETIKDTYKLYEYLKTYCAADNDILYVIIYSRTQDDNFFKVKKKIPLNTSLKISLKKNSVVQEKKDTNFIREGMYDPVIDPVIYSSNGIYYQNIYYPFTINSQNLILQFIMSSSRAYTALEEYSHIFERVKTRVLIISGILVVLVIIITFLYSYNFTLLIKSLSKHLGKAAEGKDIKLNVTEDNGLNELAITFNNVVSGLKELKKKDKIISELENKDSFSDLFKYGVNLLKENNLDDSIAIFRSLTILKPEGFGGYFNLGVAYVKKKDYDTAVSMFRKALSIKPEHELTASYIDKVNKLRIYNGSSS